MKFLPGLVTLSQIAGGVLAGGTVPFPRLLRYSGGGAFSNVVIGAGTNLVTASPGPILVGDTVLFFGAGGMTKGATAGQSEFTATVVGSTATLVGGAGGPPRADQWDDSTPAGASWNGCLVAQFVCTVAGNLTLNLNGTSLGSNSTVNNGRMDFFVFAGQ